MRLYHDEDVVPDLLREKAIAVIGYGNQGRAQALNLRDSGLNVIVGNRVDAYAARAKADRFAVHPIATAASLADVVLLLIPDEVMPEVFAAEVRSRLRQKSVLVFASGYAVAFGLLELPPGIDVVLLAPRMIGSGVRDAYVEGRGAPAFIGVAQDYSGQARAYALALAAGIGATRAGVVEVTFAQEAELDLFTEQCFGPAFGHVLTTSIDLLLEEGYPPEAVLLELYMSGEFAYTLGKIAELGMVEQASLHSTTSQYGSMSRGIRFQIPELRRKLREGLIEIRSGAFAREWAEEQAQGAPTLAMLREAARDMPLAALETELRRALGSASLGSHPVTPPPGPEARTPTQRRRLIARLQALLRRSARRPGPAAATLMAPTMGDVLPTPEAGAGGGTHTTLDTPMLRRVIEAFLSDAAADPALQAFSRGRGITSAYALTDAKLAFTLRFDDGEVTGGIGAPPEPSQVQLSMKADTFDRMLSGHLNATRATLAGDITFDGDARTALTIQRVQKDLIRLYGAARARVIG
ncbi:MAG: ketol-acid reductoisomerase [Anaerolineae bacterium]|nr:ketol-acid reductoisomerase [Anaerolineae bacterium]